MRVVTLESISIAKDMFDEYIDTQTEETDQISESFSVSDCNAIAILNNYGISATCEVVDNSTGTTYYSETIDLIRDNVSDWWDYFFAPVRIGRDSVFYFEARSNTTATITIDYSGGTAKCGMCVKGVAQEIGGSRYGIEVGINDYSIVDTNDLGLTYLSVGDWAKLANAEINIQNSNMDEIYQTIVANRGTPAIFDFNNYDKDIADGHNSINGYQALIVYGFTEDFGIEPTYPSYSRGSLDVQGLT